MIKTGSAIEFSVRIYLEFLIFLISSKHPDISAEDKEKALKLSKLVLTAWNGAEELSSEVLKEVNMFSLYLWIKSNNN